MRFSATTFLTRLGCAGLMLLVSSPALEAASALGYRVSTFGFAIDYARQLGPDVTLRAGYNLFIHGQETDSNGVHLDATLRVNAPSLLLDWHFNHSAWRITSGVAQSGPRAEANGTATGTVTFNGQTYNANELGGLRASIQPKHAVAPYFGIGRGRAVDAADRFSLLLDLGVMYQGAPQATVSADCGAALPAGQCAQLLSDIQAEVDSRERQWRDLAWWPVIGIGFAMRW